MKIISPLFILLLAGLASAQEVPLIRLELSRAETLSLAYSPELKTLKAQASSLEKKAAARLAPSRPYVSFDASYRRVTKVPEMTLGANTTRFGDYYGYSAGPSLNWLLWDSGSTRLNSESLGNLRLAKTGEAAAFEGRLVLNTRLAYFKLRYALDQTFLIGKSLKLADAQYADIKARYDAGAASRMDQLSARQELLARKRQFSQSRADLAASARDLFSGLGGKQPDLDYPADPRLKALLPSEEPAPTVILELESAEKMFADLEALAKAEPSEGHPAAAAAAASLESLKSAGRALKADRYPRLALSARAAFEYPNAAVLESVQQNSAGLSLTLPLFGGYKVTRDLEANAYDKAGAESGLAGLMDALRLEWDKASDRLRSLRAQAGINSEAVKDAEELAALTYESYRAGRSTYLEVQNSNLKALDAKLQSAATGTQLLSQLAVMAELSIKGSIK